MTKKKKNRTAKISVFKTMMNQVTKNFFLVLLEIFEFLEFTRIKVILLSHLLRDVKTRGKVVLKKTNLAQS